VHKSERYPVLGGILSLTYIIYIFRTIYTLFLNKHRERECHHLVFLHRYRSRHMYGTYGSQPLSVNLNDTSKETPELKFDVAVIGGGIGGLATAARLQRRGLSTAVLERHSVVGGCASYYQRKGFTFDVGATTLVDFEPGGVGGNIF